jgi:glycerol uptake facilitator-like aquaporin
MGQFIYDLIAELFLAVFGPVLALYFRGAGRFFIRVGWGVIIVMGIYIVGRWFVLKYELP